MKRFSRLGMSDRASVKKWIGLASFYTNEDWATSDFGSYTIIRAHTWDMVSPDVLDVQDQVVIVLWRGITPAFVV